MFVLFTADILVRLTIHPTGIKLFHLFQSRTTDNLNLLDIKYMFCTPGGYKIVKNEKGGACSAYGGGENRVQSLVGKPGGQGPLGRPRHRWEDNITILGWIFKKWGVGVWTG